VLFLLQQCSCTYSQITSISTKNLSGDVLLGPRYNLNYSTFSIIGLNIDGYSNSNHRSNIARPPGKIAIFGVDVVIRNETAGMVDGVLPVADPDIVRLNHLIFRNTGNMDLMCGGNLNFFQSKVILSSSMILTISILNKARNDLLDLVNL
jgi:hypothetical protein